MFGPIVLKEKTVRLSVVLNSVTGNQKLVPKSQKM